MSWWMWIIIGVFGFIYVVGGTIRSMAESERKKRDSENLKKLVNKGD